MAPLMFSKFLNSDYGTEVRKATNVSSFPDKIKDYFSSYFTNQKHFDFANYVSIPEMIDEMNRGANGLEKDIHKQAFTYQFFRGVLSYNSIEEWFDRTISFRTYFTVHFIPSFDNSLKHLKELSNEGWLCRAIHRTMNKYPEYSARGILDSIDSGLSINIEARRLKTDLSDDESTLHHLNCKRDTYFQKWRKSHNRFKNNDKYNSFEDWKKINPEEYERLEKRHFTYENWIDNKLPWSGWRFKFGEAVCYNESKKIREVHFLPEGEYDKIIAKQQQVLEQHIEMNLAWYVGKFNAQYARSYEKEAFLQSQIDLCNNILKNEHYTNSDIFYNAGGLVITSGSIERNSKEERIAYWYRILIVNAEHEAYTFIQSSDIDNYDRYIPQVMVFVFRRLQKHIMAHGVSKGSTIEENNTIKEIDRMEWLGSQKQLAELIVELQRKGWIKEPKYKAIKSAFTKSNTIQQVLKPSTNKKTKENEYDQIYTSQYTPVFSHISENNKKSK